MLFQLKVFENFEEHSGTEKQTGLVILCFENDQAGTLNLQQIMEDFAGLKAHRLLFRQVSTTTHSVMDVTLSPEENVNMALCVCVCTTPCAKSVQLSFCLNMCCLTWRGFILMLILSEVACCFISVAENSWCS